MQIHNNLEVWKLGISLVKEVYKVTQNFPREGLYGLASQIRRAAVSIPSNIAEGAGRNSRKEFLQFLYIALGSIAELETQLIIAKELNYLSEDQIFESLEKLRRKLINLVKYVRSET